MKFNFLSREKNVTVNHQGVKAYKMTPEMELYTAVVTTGLSDSFYESQDGRLERIKALMANCSPEFIGRLAVYARTEMYLRSVPMVLSVELAKQASGTSAVSRTVSNVIQRADEITELLAYYQIANNREGVKKLNGLSKQIQKGLVEEFNKFNEYQFAKYNRNTDVRLRDALFLVHPKAKNESQQAIFNKIASDTLATPYTWETELSALGKVKFTNDTEKQSAFALKWEELIESKKLGYMALMRSLRNILDAGISAKHIQMVCEYLGNEKAVANSKQLPFRFLAAYRELRHNTSGYTPVVMQALEEAIKHSAQNIRGFGVNTSIVIACDVSGSMQKAVSPKSSIMLYDIGLLLAMLMKSRCKNVVAGMFGDTWKQVAMPASGILSNVDAFYRREGEVGYATNGHLVIEDLIKRKQKADKVMLFTDTQMYNSNIFGSSFGSCWERYKAIAPNAKLYLFDLAGYGKMPLDIRRDDVYLIAGWSDKIFDVLDSLENSVSAVEKISQINL